MNLFSISQLQQFSGIKAHTIRVWEQRYNALSPSRTEGNTRYYDNTQLRRLLNITSLMHSEFKISELCGMRDNQLFKLLASQQGESELTAAKNKYYLSQLISSGMSFNEKLFEETFTNCTQNLGLRNAYTKVIYPLLVRLGLMWANNSMPAIQEHFISNLLRQKLSAAINLLPLPKSQATSWLLFLPENEFHEVGLLLSHFLIRQSGERVIYLGGNVPITALTAAAKDLSPTNILLFLVRNFEVEESQSTLNILSKHFNKTNIHVAGSEKLLGQLSMGRKVFWMRSVEELENKLREK